MFLPVSGEFVSRLWRTDAVHMHVRAQGYGHLRSHFAEQRARRGLEDHRHAAAGDGFAAERDDHEPKRDRQGTDLKVGSMREPERRRARGRAARGQEERRWGKKHDGGCIEGPRGHFGATITDFTVAEAEVRKPGGRLLLPRTVSSLWGTLRKAPNYDPEPIFLD